jgi:hypothetical protein
MWNESQDENALDGQGEAKKVLSAMQDFCFIPRTGGFVYGAYEPEYRNRMIAPLFGSNAIITSRVVLNRSAGEIPLYSIAPYLNAVIPKER